MFPLVRPLHPGEHDAVVRAAQANGHGVLLPSHLIDKGGHIAGALGIARVALLHAWAHTEHLRGRDTFHTMNVAENLALNLTGCPLLLVPVSPDSPLVALLQRRGYTQVMGGCDLYIKKGI